MDIPNIDIKITRQGDKVKFVVDKYQLVLKPLENGKSQTYDFVLFEQWVTRVAKQLYQEIVDKEKIKKNLREAFMGGAEEAGEAEFVSNLLGE